MNARRDPRVTQRVLLLLCLCCVATDATLFKWKYRAQHEQDSYDPWKGKRALQHQHSPYFGLSGLEQLYAFKPLTYAVPKLIPVPHPVPVTVERPVPIPVPVHLGKALGEYEPTAYEHALHNYVHLTKPQHYSHGHGHQARSLFGGTSSSAFDSASDCHPYCDLHLPQGSSPVPLVTKEQRLKVMTLEKGDQGQ